MSYQNTGLYVMSGWIWNPKPKKLERSTVQKEGKNYCFELKDRFPILYTLFSVTCDSPLYILPHSQAVLLRAIESDTQFLASLSVIDYSLLVGLDQEKRELIIGIIGERRTVLRSNQHFRSAGANVRNKIILDQVISYGVTYQLPSF